MNRPPAPFDAARKAAVAATTGVFIPKLTQRDLAGLAVDAAAPHIEAEVLDRVRQRALACLTCGKIHELAGGTATAAPSWASRDDGHPYRRPVTSLDERVVAWLLGGAG